MDQDIIIKQGDKGGGIVIMNTTFQRDKINEMLDNTIFYKPTDEENVKPLKLIQTTFKHADMTNREKEYLINFDVKQSSFYGLPKIHRS